MGLLLSCFQPAPTNEIETGKNRIVNYCCYSTVYYTDDRVDGESYCSVSGENVDESERRCKLPRLTFCIDTSRKE